MLVSYSNSLHEEEDDDLSKTSICRHVDQTLGSKTGAQCRREWVDHVDDQGEKKVVGGSTGVVVAIGVVALKSCDGTL